MAVDPKWEFDCPQYVDFNKPLHCDEAVDSFFDSHLEVSADFTNSFPTQKTSASQCTHINAEKKDSQTVDKKKTHTSYTQAMSSTLKKLYPLRKTPSRLAREATDSPTRKKMCFSDKKACAVSSSHSLARHNRSITSKKRFGASSKITKKYRSPQYVRKTMDKLLKKVTKSSEEIEMDKIKELRKELVAHRKLSKQSMKKALLNPAMSQNSSSFSQNQHTIVRPFKFATESRIKNTAEIKSNKEKDFVSSLRSNIPQQQHSFEKVTKPVPFKLSTNRKRKFDEVKESYCPLAEQIEAFQHGKAFTTINTKNAKDIPCQLTRPKTPNLRAVARCRPITALSQTEKEDLLIQEMKSYKFKANIIKAGVMNKPQVLKPVEHKSITRSENVHLETERRYMLRQRTVSKPEETKFEFHANPAPKRIFEQIVGLKQKIEFPHTNPQSPAFALKQRVQTWKDKNATSSTETVFPVFKAQPLPHSGIQFWPKFHKKFTMTEPFSFEKQDNERRALKERKIQEEIEKQLKIPEFKARPMLTSPKTDLPIVSKMPLTQVQPFNLLSDQRGSEKAKKWREEIEEEFLRQKQATVFKAGSNKAIYNKPFVPTGSLKPSSDVMCIKLHTEQRAEERENFESQKCLRQKKLEEAYERQQKEQKQKEEAEIAKLRIETVHKPLPVKHCKPKPIQKSTIELTQPQSPFLYTRLRSKDKHNVVIKGSEC